jgi:hypothetical protein
MAWPDLCEFFVNSSVKHKRERLADFEIDKLTNSIENVRTEETFNTEA